MMYKYLQYDYVSIDLIPEKKLDSKLFRNG